jgi:hypothetical protein
MTSHMRVFSRFGLIGMAACAPEATAPQGSAAIGQVVPIAVPDVWCPATADSTADTAAAKGRGRCPTSAPVKSDSQSSANADQTWKKIQGKSLRLVADSAAAASDTTR